MNRFQRSLPALVAALILAGAFAVPAGADGGLVVATALGADGRLVSLLRGTYGELAPNGSLAEASEPVLALRTTLPDGQQALHVIPATLDYEREEAAELVIEPRSGVAYVLWQSWRSEIHSRFRVAAFDGERWGETIEISSPSSLWRILPVFAVTQDSYDDLSVAAEEDRKVHRTVLHVVWLEEGSDTAWQTLYAPLVLVDGEYLGHHPVLVLEDHVTSEDGAATRDIPVPPVLRSRDADNSVVAAFVNQRTGDLNAIELKVAAGELSSLGDVVESEIVAFGEEAGGVGASEISDAVRLRLMEFEHQIKPEILAQFGVTVEEHVREQLDKGSTAKAAGGAARVQLVDVGFRLTDGRLNRTGAGARVQLVDVGARSERPRGHHRHDARFSVTLRRSLPEDVPAAPELLVSSRGTKLILAWREDSRIRYRESVAGGGWSAMQQILLTDQLAGTQAMAVLQRRVEQ